MKITTDISTDNASFETEGDYATEILRIMDNIKYKLSNGLEYCKIRDLNGNTIGFYQVEDMPSYAEMETNEDN